MRIHHTVVPALALLAALTVPRPASPQGLVLPRTTAAGTRPVTPTRIRIAAEVTDRAARVHLDQTFRNEGTTPLEGTFVLALPPGAVASELAFHMDGKRISGELVDRARARAVYESIVRQYRDPALLEWEGRSLFRVSLFPIPPGGESRVEVVYAAIVPADLGRAELALPLRVPSATGAPVADTAVRVELSSEQPLGPIWSPSHQVSVTRISRTTARIDFASAALVLDRDLSLTFAPAERGVGLDLVTYHPAGEDGYFVLLLAPEFSTATRPAKDVVFVLDTSGSMREGGKLGKAVKALSFGLTGLGPADRFGLVTFATEARPWRETLAPASDATAAIEHLDDLEATGGTAISEALDAGLRLFRDEKGTRPRYLVFLTDGLPTIGETDPERILAQVPAARTAPRIFPFGVGDDVNAPLLDELAERGRGRTQYVRPEEDLEVKVSSFFARLNYPALTDIEVTIDGVSTRDRHPREIPDLFRGDDLVLTGRYAADGSARIRVEGALLGQPWSTTRTVSLPRRDVRRPHVAILWAERRIGYLLEQMRQHPDRSELKDEVVRLARAHGLVTPYTSYLVAEEEPAVVASASRPRNVPQPRRVEAWPYDPAASGAADASGIAMDATVGTARSVETSVVFERMKGANSAAHAQGLRVVHGKRFRRIDAVWIDEDYRSGLTEERVVLFGARYFALLREDARLADVFALGERVIVVWGGTAYRVEP